MIIPPFKEKDRSTFASFLAYRMACSSRLQYASRSFPFYNRALEFLFNNLIKLTTLIFSISYLLISSLESIPLTKTCFNSLYVLGIYWSSNFFQTPIYHYSKEWRKIHSIDWHFFSPSLYVVAKLKIIFYFYWCKKISSSLLLLNWDDFDLSFKLHIFKKMILSAGGWTKDKLIAQY